MCVCTCQRFCVCERGKDKHTYLIHSQWHTYAVLFHQHGVVPERTVSVLQSVYLSCLGCIADGRATLLLDCSDLFSDALLLLFC